ncbi:MAG: WbqC family protein [Chitinophagales bacterium]
MPVLLYLPYFPNVFWLKHFLQADEVLIEAEENVVKGSFRNRCEIAGPNGRQLLSVPLNGGRDHHQAYKHTLMRYDIDWRKNHWQSIKAAYGSAPYFEHYDYKLQPLFNTTEANLFAHNQKVLQTVLGLLKVQKPYALTQQYTKSAEGFTDLRNTKALEAQFSAPRYYQVFEDRHGFMNNLSVLDLLFNLGPRSMEYLREI